MIYFYLGANFDQNDGFVPGDNYIGFKFEAANDATHYGRATINLDLSYG